MAFSGQVEIHMPHPKHKSALICKTLLIFIPLMLFGFNPRYVLGEYHYRFYTKNVFEQIIKRSRFQEFKFSGNFVIYSKDREKILGSLFEELAEIKPSFAEHLIVCLMK